MGELIQNISSKLTEVAQHWGLTKVRSKEPQFIHAKRNDPLAMSVAMMLHKLEGIFSKAFNDEQQAYSSQFDGIVETVADDLDKRVQQAVFEHAETLFHPPLFYYDQGRELPPLPLLPPLFYYNRDKELPSRPRPPRLSFDRDKEQPALPPDQKPQQLSISTGETLLDNVSSSETTVVQSSSAAFATDTGQPDDRLSRVQRDQADETNEEEEAFADPERLESSSSQEQRERTEETEGAGFFYQWPLDEEPVEARFNAPKGELPEQYRQKDTSFEEAVRVYLGQRDFHYTSLKNNRPVLSDAPIEWKAEEVIFHALRAIATHEKKKGRSTEGGGFDSRYLSDVVKTQFDNTESVLRELGEEGGANRVIVQAVSSGKHLTLVREHGTTGLTSWRRADSSNESLDRDKLLALLDEEMNPEGGRVYLYAPPEAT